MTDGPIIDLGSRREPVTYTVRLRHGWDGSLAIWVHDVADDERSRTSVADALCRAAEQIAPEHGACSKLRGALLRRIQIDRGCVNVVCAEIGGENCHCAEAFAKETS